MPRKHPLFPTYTEVKENPHVARSDHLLILSKVPLGEQGTLNIASLNILGGENCSGIHPLRMEIPEGHTLNRYQHIAEGLGNSIAKHNVDVILLQEADPMIVPYLKQFLKKDWEIIADKFGVISCYNKKRLNLQYTTENEASRIRTMQFKDKHNNLSIDIHNIWGIYSPFPQHMEKQYHSLLTNTKSNVSVIMGDTNSRIAPIDNNKRNLSTGIVPPIIAQLNDLSPELQITDHPDGGFYRSQNGSIKQLETVTLDFDTADIASDERSEAEADVWPEFRMVMCLDDYYKNTPIVGGKTIFDYESSLQQRLNNDSLLVRMASDSYNNKAIALRFPNRSASFSLIREELKNIPGFQFKTLDSTAHEDRAARFSCVFAPIDKLDLLCQAVDKAVLRHKLVKKINSDIDRLLKTHWYFRDSSEKIASLTELKDRITNAPSQSTAEDLLTLIKTWENEEAPSLPSVTENQVKNKHDLIALHRNIFFSPRRPGTPTETENTIQWLKESLGDKQSVELKL